MFDYYVYILTNKQKTLYIGITNSLERRMYEHRMKLIDGFTKKYNLTRLVHYEHTNDIDYAILREKQLKGWLRQKKVDLIEQGNPEWKDLSEEWFQETLDPSLRSG